jgi:hypothetical protein
MKATCGLFKSQLAVSMPFVSDASSSLLIAVRTHQPAGDSFFRQLPFLRAYGMSNAKERVIES